MSTSAKQQREGAPSNKELSDRISELELEIIELQRAYDDARKEILVLNNLIKTLNKRGAR